MAETNKVKHPKEFYVLFFTEMWERFGYYLMPGILFLYLTDKARGGMGLSRAEAADIAGTYLGLLYLTPVSRWPDHGCGELSITMHNQL